MSFDIRNLSSDGQAAFLLALSNKIVDLISASAGYKLAKEALEVCWSWVEKKNVTGDNIYEYLENEDETGLVIQMQFEEDGRGVNVWNCLVDAIAFTSWKAYQHDGEKYLPAPIEEVDEDLVDHFLTAFHAVDSSNAPIAERLGSYLLENYPAENRNPIFKNEIMKTIGQ